MKYRVWVTGVAFCFSLNVVGCGGSTNGALDDDNGSPSQQGSPDAAGAPQVICEPGARQCTADFSDVAVCSADGKSWQPSSTCKSSEACARGACVPAETTLGEIMVLAPAQTMDPVALAPGKYGLAVVNTLPVLSPDQVPFPVRISGELLDTSAQARHPVLHRAHPRLRRWPLHLNRTPGEARRYHGAPPIYTVGERRTFQYPDDETQRMIPRTAVLRYSGKGVNLWEDITAVSQGQVIADADLNELARRIEDAKVRDMAVFGAMTDVDGNGKADIFFTDLLADYGAFTGPETMTDTGGESDFGEVVYTQGPTDNVSVSWLSSAIAHEMVHLIYFGTLMQPYLARNAAVPEELLYSDVFVAEGVAELGWILAGQIPADTMAMALENPHYWAFGELFLSNYPDDQAASYALYGLGALLVEYLFEQAGGVEYSTQGGIVDHGGQKLLKQIIAGRPGVTRLAALDGRRAQQVYVDMAAAVLRGSLGEYLAAVPTDRPTPYAFRPVQKDSVFGGLIGVPQAIEEYFPDAPEKGPALARTPWAKHSATLLEGGAAFHDLLVGNGGATLKNSDVNTHVVLLRYSTVGK